MTYLIGQTATVDIGPIIDVRTGDAFDPPDLAVAVTSPDGTVTDLTAEIIEVEVDDEHVVGRFYINVPLPTATILRGKWTWGTGDEIGAEKFVLIATDEITLASVEDVQARLGRATLTDTAITQILLLLDSATGLILDAGQKDKAWALALDEIPPVLRSICIEAVTRIALNPEGVRYTQEQLGAHGRAVTFIGNGGLELTDAEELRINRAIYRRTTASVAVESMINTHPRQPSATAVDDD